MDIPIYHNPACGTSRNVLALIRNTGVEPEVIEYLKQPPSRETLAGLIAQAGLPVRDVMRQKGTLYGAGAGQPGAGRRRAAGRDAGPSDPDQPAHRGDAAGHAPVPPVGGGAGHPAAAAARRRLPRKTASR